MSYVVTFEDYRPAPRYAPLTGPWTQIRIEEASSQTGSWTELETIDLDPLDSDPTEPRARDFTTDLATLAQGWYRIVWLDADGNSQPTSPRLNFAGTTTPSWLPTVADIAKLCPAHTRHPIDGSGEQAGSEQKVFDSETDPTDEDVQGYIDTAVEEILGRVGVGIPALESFAELAKTTAKWHAAASVEAGEAPDTADETTGAYSWKQSSYVACLNELIKQARVGFLRVG